MKKSGFLLLLLLLIALFAAGQVYKWVDEQGGVHFGDRPPRQTDAEEVGVPQGPSVEEMDAAQREFQQAIEAREERDRELAEKQEEVEQEKLSSREEKEQRFIRCVKAREQLLVLGYKVRVFRIRPDWTREYLENEDRPVETSRLRNLVEEYCDTDEESRKRQILGAYDLAGKLKVTCIAPREKLGKMGDPATQFDREKAAEYRTYLYKNCPAVDFRDMWIADRVFVGKRH